MQGRGVCVPVEVITPFRRSCSWRERAGVQGTLPGALMGPRLCGIPSMCGMGRFQTLESPWQKNHSH